MRLQLLSDLHLESEAFDPEPAPDAELLVLAGDIDSTWAGLERFARWPVRCCGRQSRSIAERTRHGPPGERSVCGVRC
jgi:hypothetical protein